MSSISALMYRSPKGNKSLPITIEDQGEDFKAVKLKRLPEA